MSISDATRQPGQDPQALHQLATLLELILDEGAPAFALRSHEPAGWQVLTGDPEGPVHRMKEAAVLSPALAHSLMQLTVDGLNVVTIGGETYRFARAEYPIGDRNGTIFVPG
jgi:hypothetical protein